jgi:glutathione S-transferase
MRRGHTEVYEEKSELAMAEKNEEKEKKVQLLRFWPSPFSLRVDLALALKGIQYEKLEQNLGDKSPLLLASNPVYKTVPVLLHGGRPICESSIILHYIDEAFPDSQPPLLPADAFGRATARFWADFVDKKVTRYRNRLVRNRYINLLQTLRRLSP